MLALALVGALVLAMVSWAALREAQRMPRSFPAVRQANAASAGDATQRAASQVNGRPVLALPRAQVVEDPTIAGADTDEALAAAAALWHVLVDDEDH
jgi:hypothetical protein